jgi:hypothetical protein
MFEVLDIFIPGQEYWDETKNEFVYTKDTTLHLKHSLISLFRWEQKYKRRYLDQGPDTVEENIYYIKCMTMNREPIDDLVYQSISEADYQKILDYIRDPMSATIIPKQTDDEESREKLSAELIYYYMAQLQLPIECERWHLNNLLKIIQIGSIKNKPKNKKRSAAAIMRDYSALNKRNRAKFHTKG